MLSGIFIICCSIMMGIFGLSIIAAGDRPKGSQPAPETDQTFTLDPHIYGESRSIKATDGRETQLYENTFYLLVGNFSDDGKTLKRVQARIQGYETPVVAEVRDSASKGEIDIRHGEWAFFVIGRTVTTSPSGTFAGWTTISDASQIKSYEHNLQIEAPSFEISTFDAKRRFALAVQSFPPTGWRVSVLISAEDKKSRNVALVVAPKNLKSPVFYESPEAEKKS
jgi:hypothetical protein